MISGTYVQTPPGAQLNWRYRAFRKIKHDPIVLLHRDWDSTDNTDILTCEHGITDGGDGERKSGNDLFEVAVVAWR